VKKLIAAGILGLAVSGCGQGFLGSSAGQTCTMQDQYSVVQVTGQSSCSGLGTELAQADIGSYWAPVTDDNMAGLSVACTFPGITIWGSDGALGEVDASSLCSVIQQQGGVIQPS
jgi:hypothetical protein